MTDEEARTLLARLRHGNRHTYPPQTLSALDHALQKLGGTPTTTREGVHAAFVTIAHIPDIWYPGQGLAQGMCLPSPSSGQPVGFGWNRALAFHSLSRKPGTLDALIKHLLGSRWRVADVAPGKLALTTGYGEWLVIPAPPELIYFERGPDGDVRPERHPDATEQDLLDLLAPYAAAQNIDHSGELDCINPKEKPFFTNTSSIQALQFASLRPLRSIDALRRWRQRWGRSLLCALLAERNPRHTMYQLAHRVDHFPGAGLAAWDRWVRGLPGMRRLELAIAGFFANGGEVAYPACAVASENGSNPVHKETFLEDQFDHTAGIQRLCAPGLCRDWQRAIAAYAQQRSGLLAIQEAPRFLLSEPPADVVLRCDRALGYPHLGMVGALQTLPDPAHAEPRSQRACESLRAAPRTEPTFGPWLLTDNPLSTCDIDRFVVAPPSGHAAAAYVPGSGTLGRLQGAHAPIVPLTEQEANGLWEGIRFIALRDLGSRGAV